MLTIDHGQVPLGQEGRQAEKYAVVIKDVYTEFTIGEPVCRKSADDTVHSIQTMCGPCKYGHMTIYSDDSPEIASACHRMQVMHNTAQPFRPETNGIAEQAVRRIKEGTASLLVQSGLNHKWWPMAMRCFCAFMNAIDETWTGHSAYYNRFGQDAGLPLIPFGCSVDYMPSEKLVVEKLPKFGNKTLPGIFAGYELHHGGRWAQRIFVLDKADLESAKT